MEPNRLSDMINPLVSILSPCYNVGQFLPKYFETVLGQTYSNLQVVLIDDGSKDNTWAVMQEYSAKDSRVEIYHQENQGVAAARNVLLSKIKGDAFLFVDSDDWMELDMVEFLVERAAETGAEMVTCGMVKNDAPVMKRYEEKIYDRDKAVERFLYHKEFRGSLCNKLINISLLHNEQKFHCGISYGEDALFCWGLLKQVKKVVYTDRQLYHYRMNDSSLSHETFGPKKMSGVEVWKTICDETSKEFPLFLPIAQARFCIESALLLRNAAHCGYKERQDIILLQSIIKQNYHRLIEVKLSSLKMLLFAFFACRSYRFAKLF